MKFIFFKKPWLRWLVKIGIEYPIISLLAFFITLYGLYQYTDNTYVNEYMEYTGTFIEKDNNYYITLDEAEEIHPEEDFSEVFWHMVHSDHSYPGLFIYYETEGYVIVPSDESLLIEQNAIFNGQSVIIETTKNVSILTKVKRNFLLFN